MSRAEAPPEPPEGLAALQEAFGEAIATPLLIGGPETLIQVDRYPEPALRAVSGHGGRSGPERLMTYNKQYWFRLLTVMQEELPLLRHLMGLTAFNQMVTDYLDAHPSRSQLLQHLSDDLEGFLAGSERWGRPAWRQAARLERHYIRAFDAAALPALDPAALPPEVAAGLLTAPLRLQPHWALFEEGWDLLSWRRRVKGDADDAIAVTLTAQPGRWAIYRSGRVQAEALTVAQLRLLERLAAGLSLQAACDGLAEVLDPEGMAEVGAGIQSWFARWVALGWFAAP